MLHTGWTHCMRIFSVTLTPYDLFTTLSSLKSRQQRLCFTSCWWQSFIGPLDQDFKTWAPHCHHIQLSAAAI